MQGLSIKTDFPSNQGGVDFSILPSPSTFFLSSLNSFQQSPTYDQYPHSATDYHSHFKQESAIEPDYAILPSLSSQESSSNGRSPSPASSFPSTPSGSPIPGHLQVDLTKGEQEMLPMHNNKMDSAVNAVSYASLNSFYPAEIPSQQLYFNCASSQEEQFTLPPPHRNHYQHHPYQVTPQYAPIYGQQGFSGNSAPSQMGFVQQEEQPRFAPPPAPAPQQQQQYSMAQAPSYAPPPPAAIETPHGTYYFVPNVHVVPSVAAPTPVMRTVEPIQLPTPPPHNVVGSPMNFPTPSPSPPAATQSQAGYVKLSNGLTAGVAIAQGTNARRSASGATATVIVGGQKLRLPVGQGKRGSTKRPAKKDQVKRFICPHPGCGRGFARNFNMQSHHKSHLGIREFNCPHCPKKFSRRHDRARHCSAVHDSQVDRDGNIAGTSMSSGSPSASVNDEEFDDYNDDGGDKNYLVDYAD